MRQTVDETHSGALAEAQLQFETQGFIHVKEAIPPDILKLACEQFDSAAERHHKQWHEGVARGTEDARFFDIPHILDQHSVFIDLVDLPSVFPLLLRLIGSDIQLNHTHARLFYPGPTFTNPWHSDVSHVLGINQAHSLNFYAKLHYFLEDMTSEQGCLAFIPGSHRYPPSHPRPVIRDIDASTAAIKIVPKAGDAVIFNAHLLHMATDNRTEKVRKSIIYVYSHFWVKHYANAVPADIDRYATTEQRQQLFGVDIPGVPYFNRRLNDSQPVPWYSTFTSATKRILKRGLMKKSYVPNR